MPKPPKKEKKPSEPKPKRPKVETEGANIEDDNRRKSSRIRGKVSLRVYSTIIDYLFLITFLAC